MGPTLWMKERITIMSDSETEKHVKSVKLTNSNYKFWAVAMQGKLMIVNAWQIITKDLKRAVDTGEAEKWLLKRDEATGIILKSLTPTRYIHIKGIMDNPIKMWNRLRAMHWLQVANSHFHAMQKLLSIWREDGELLTDYITWINTATNDLIVIVRIVLFFIQYRTQEFFVCVLDEFLAIYGIYACVTKHSYRCPSLAGTNQVSSRAGINFVEYMRYKSVRFYNSLE